MSFAAPAESYDRYMGRYSRRLAPLFADFAGVRSGMRVIDVGCGPGALTEVLAERTGAERVSAADPSESFVESCAERVPGADIRRATAERLPWGDGTFDAVLAQLVVNFIEDPVEGVGEMRRVARAPGVIAACTWDYRDGMEMLGIFWDAALALDPDAPAEGRRMRFGKPDELRALWREAELVDIRTDALEVAQDYEGFDDYWEPFTAGVGPGGAYCASLPSEAQDALGEECRRRLENPERPFRLHARAWAVRGRARGRAASARKRT
jgi:ubiquinone/menaquinone biosynthesis C-methylase UbiE